MIPNLIVTSLLSTELLYVAKATLIRRRERGSLALTTRRKMTSMMMVKSTMYANRRCTISALEVCRLVFHRIRRNLRTHDCLYASYSHFARTTAAATGITIGAAGSDKPPTSAAKAPNSGEARKLTTCVKNKVTILKKANSPCHFGIRRQVPLASPTLTFRTSPIPF